MRICIHVKLFNGFVIAVMTQCPTSIFLGEWRLDISTTVVFSSAVPTGSGAFQMPTHPKGGSRVLESGGGDKNIALTLHVMVPTTGQGPVDATPWASPGGGLEIRKIEIRKTLDIIWFLSTSGSY